MINNSQSCKRSLLEISQLNEVELFNLLQLAKNFSQQIYVKTAPKMIAQLFFENSTRTAMSFELAAKKLQHQVISLNAKTSSIAKGETDEDTIATIAAMGVDAIVMRHTCNDLIFSQAEIFKNKLHFINAGSGMRAHPSQALLDLFTIWKAKAEQLENLVITIVGDLKHSRVVRSLLVAFQLAKIKNVRLVAPKPWQLEQPIIGEQTDNLSQALEAADVVITLRIQQERLEKNENLNLKTYQQAFMLNQAKLNLAKPDVCVMHPGPINRGIEISDEVANGVNSLILEQVANGVSMRQAIFHWLFS